MFYAINKKISIKISTISVIRIKRLDKIRLCQSFFKDLGVKSWRFEIDLGIRKIAVHLLNISAFFSTTTCTDCIVVLPSRYEKYWEVNSEIIFKYKLNSHGREKRK